MNRPGSTSSMSRRCCQVHLNDEALQSTQQPAVAVSGAQACNERRDFSGGWAGAGVGHDEADLVFVVDQAKFLAAVRNFIAMSPR